MFKSLKIVYKKQATCDLKREIDADRTGDVKDRKSTKGYYFKLNGRGALSWGVRSTPHLLFVQETVYQVMAAVDQEVFCLKYIFDDFDI